MKITKHAFAAVLFAGSVMTFPAHAQVAGIATVNSTEAMYDAKGLDAAFKEIEVSYAQSIATTRQKAQEAAAIEQQLYKQFDANNDSKVDDAELAKLKASKSPLIAQLEAKNAEASEAKLPFIRAQLFAIENLLMKYRAAQQQVITAKKISIILTPSSFIYAPDAVDITQAVTAALDKATPTLPINPEPNWQPAQQTVELFKAFGAIDERNAQIAALQAQQQAAAQQQGQPAPAAGQPVPAPAPAPAPAGPADDGRGN